MKNDFFFFFFSFLRLQPNIERCVIFKIFSIEINGALLSLLFFFLLIFKIATKHRKMCHFQNIFHRNKWSITLAPFFL
jgi:hypothetical protein